MSKYLSADECFIQCKVLKHFIMMYRGIFSYVGLRTIIFKSVKLLYFNCGFETAVEIHFYFSAS